MNQILVESKQMLPGVLRGPPGEGAPYCCRPAGDRILSLLLIEGLGTIAAGDGI